MTKIRTTIEIDRDLWTKFSHYVLDKHGTTKKRSFELGQILSAHLQSQKNRENRSAGRRR